jgi:hypothetical protein
LVKERQSRNGAFMQDSEDHWQAVSAPMKAIIARLSQDGAVDPAELHAALASAAAILKAGLERHYSLAQAARKFFPDGSITKRSLLTEIKKGRLRAKSVAGKYLVTESDIRAMLEACTCRSAEEGDANNLPGSTSASVPDGNQPTQFSTERVKLAQAAARTNLRALKKLSKLTSPANTDQPPVPLRSRAS